MGATRTRNVIIPFRRESWLPVVAVAIADDDGDEEGFVGAVGKVEYIGTEGP